MIKAFMRTNAMKSLLDHHSWHELFPDCASPWLSSFTHDDVTILQPIAIHFVMCKPHFTEVLKIAFTPAHIDVGKVRERFPFVLLVVQHLSQAELCNSSQRLRRPL